MSALLWLITPKILEKINMIGQQLVATLCALPLGALLFLVIRGGFRVSTANVGDAYFSNDQYLNLSAINPAFNLFASTERQARYEDEFNFYDEQRRAQLMKGLYDTNDTNTTQVLETQRPNILVIFMESFGATMIERLGGEKGVGLTAVMSALLWLITPKILEKINMIGQQLVATLCALPLGALLFLVIRGGFRVSTANVGDAYFSNDQYLNLSAINPAFNLFASTERQARYEDEFNFYDEQRRAQLMKGLYDTNDTNTTQVLETQRPNILVIFMESFGATMIERLGGEKGVAPNLESLADNGVFFSRIFANSFRTDRGTVCTFSGFPGLPTLSLMKVSNLCQQLPNIANMLGQAGYETDFLYGGDINFTNMQGYLRAGGFQKITSQDDFSLTERNYSKWGVPDGITFNHLYDMLKERENSKKPWFTTFLTLSSHEPFEVPYKKFEDAHFNAFAYTDHCIGEFIRRFRKTKQWKNTLIVLLPDHGIPYPKEGERFSPRFFRIPMIWTGGAVRQKMTVEKIMNQTDLAATLLAQLGLKHDNFLFSRNVLSESYTYPFAFYSFVNGFCFLDNTGVSVYDNASNKVFFNVAPEGDSVRVQKGKAILQTLYDEVGQMNSKRYK